MLPQKITKTCVTVFLGLLFSVPGFAQTEKSAPTVTLDSAESPALSDEDFLGKSFTTTSTLYLASNYIFRGISQTRNRAAVQGSYDLTHTSGFGLGGFVSNVDLDVAPAEKTKTEADVYALYNGEIGKVGWGVMALWYTYLENSKYNYPEFAIFAKYNILKIDVAHTPKYNGFKSAALYSRLSATLPLNKKDNFVATAGQTTFDKDENVGFKSYNDYKLAITHTASDFTTEFAYTDTDREDLAGETFLDRAMTVTLSRTF